MGSVKRVLYRRQLILFLVLSLVLVGVLSVLVFSSFRTFSERQMELSLTSSMRRVDHQVRFVFERAIYVALALYRSPVAQAVLYRGEIDELDRVAAQQDLRERIAAHPFLYSAALYNRDTGFVGTSPRAEAAESPQRIVELLDGGSSRERAYLVRRLQSPGTGFSDQEVITLVYSEDPSPMAYRHAVVIDIPFRSILEHLASTSDADGTQTFFMIDDSDITFPRRYERIASIIAERAMESDHVGTMTVDEHGGRALAGFVRTGAANTTTVMLYPLTELQEAAYALQRRIAIIALLVLAVGWALSVGLTRYAYLPVQQLLDRVDPEHFYASVRSRLNEMEYVSTHFSQMASRAARLEDESLQQTSVLDELRLRALLLGEPVPDSLQSWNDDRTAYWCLLIYVRSGHVHDYDHEHVRQVVREVAPGEAVAVFVARGESVVLVPRRADGVHEPELHALGEHIMERLNDTDEAFAAAVLDAPVEASQLRSARQRLVSLQRHELFHDVPIVCTPAFVERAHGRRADYPASLEKDLLEDLCFGHRRSYVNRVTDLCARLSDCTYESTVSVLLQLALVLVRSVEQVEKTTEPRHGYYVSDMTRAAERWGSFEDVVRWFTDIYDLFQAATRNADDAVGEQGRERIERAIGFIRANLDDAQLSVPTIAEQVGISRSYFSRVFKQHARVSVNEFITRERIEQAQRLLASTSDTVETISVACGIRNTKYFFQLFRRHVGVTPAAYRAAHRAPTGFTPRREAPGPL